MTDFWMVFGNKAVNMAQAKLMTQSAAGVLITLDDSHPDVLAADLSIDDILTAMGAGQSRVTAIAKPAQPRQGEAVESAPERILSQWQRRLSADAPERHFDDGLTKPPRQPGNDQQAMRSIGRG